MNLIKKQSSFFPLILKIHKNSIILFSIALINFLISPSPERIKTPDMQLDSDILLSIITSILREAPFVLLLTSKIE